MYIVKSSQRMLKRYLQILEPRYIVDKLFKTSVALSHENEWEGMQVNHYFDEIMFAVYSAEDN